MAVDPITSGVAPRRKGLRVAAGVSLFELARFMGKVEQVDKTMGTCSPTR